MEEKTLKIAVTGPESTGKSMLAEQLAVHYSTVWVPEYARSYIEKLPGPYDRNDILAIAKGQLEEEQRQSANAKRFLFCDTELIVTKIWSEVKYGSCDKWILEKISSGKYDLFLLCDIDLPWVEDPQREHPHMRQYLFDLYKNELLARNFPFLVISGTGKERLNNAVTGIETFFSLPRYI